MSHHQVDRARLLSLLVLLTIVTASSANDDGHTLYRADFDQTPLGAIPAGWRDLNDGHANLTWGVDGRGFLRTMLKNFEGMVLYEGALADRDKGEATLTDAVAEAAFKKTPDHAVSISVIGRVQDKDNFYAARFSGLNQLELVRVKSGEPTTLVSNVTLAYCLNDAIWRLSLSMEGDHLIARVVDEHGIDLARADAKDAEFESGQFGLRATQFAAVKSFNISAPAPFERKLSDDAIAARNVQIAKSAGVQDYAIVKPVKDVASLNTPFEKLQERYDVIVAGAGTGGSAAAIQAARLGAKVLLIEESDWIGGQMSAAAVTTMDEEGLWYQFPVRERGFYREFHESMVNYYYTLEMDPYRAYASWPIQTEGGYEPKATRAALYAFIERVRKSNPQAVLDVCPATRVARVQKDGNRIAGVTLASYVGDAEQSRDIACHVLIEATEYGDVLPLTGARYRVGNTTSDSLDPAGIMQDNTWTAVIRDYPHGVPEHLKVTSPPPGYERIGKLFQKYRRAGLYIWGPPSKGVKGPRDWRVYFRWRGMADADSPLVGLATEQRHTQCGLNGGNDYAMTVAQLEDPARRLENERHGIYLTLGIIYYFQNEVGVNWALAEDEGYNTPYNQRMMKQRDLRPDLAKLAVHMPQWPYVRESRRGVGVYTLRTSDMGRFDNAKHWPTSVAMGDYFMDLHRSEEQLEPDLDPGSWAAGDFAKGGGPFQVPFEVFIPETIDGLVLAEKNIAQSRLVNGATRLQPITMLTGQAAGAISALSAAKNIQPRELNPVAAQIALLEAGSTLVPRWYADVPWGTQVWRDSQLLSLYGILDRPGAIHHRHGPLRETSTWEPDAAVLAAEAQDAASKLAKLTGGAKVSLPDVTQKPVPRKEFAATCVRVLREMTK